MAANPRQSPRRVVGDNVRPTTRVEPPPLPPRSALVAEDDPHSEREPAADRNPFFSDHAGTGGRLVRARRVSPWGTRAATRCATSSRAAAPRIALASGIRTTSVRCSDISKRTTRAADRIDDRWRERADDRGIFAREVLEAIERLETTQRVGQSFSTTRRPSLRRVLLPKSRCHIYFETTKRSRGSRSFRSGTAAAKTEAVRLIAEPSVDPALACE